MILMDGPIHYPYFIGGGASVQGAPRYIGHPSPSTNQSEGEGRVARLYRWGPTSHRDRDSGPPPF